MKHDEKTRKTIIKIFVITATVLILLPSGNEVATKNAKVIKAIQNNKLIKKEENKVAIKEQYKQQEYKQEQNIEEAHKKESFKNLEIDEVNQLIGDLDLEIEIHDFVQRANEGSLSKVEIVRFERLLTKRNKLFNHKVALLVKKAKAKLWDI